jgi:dihydroflavonol-4-reductase
VKRVAVTGANGFIGRHVMQALAARGDQPVGSPRPYEPARLAGQFAGLDAVVHLAGVVSAVREREFYAANVDATRTIAEAARVAGTRLVHISSLAAAGPAAPAAPRTESDAPAPINAYGQSKLEGERAIAAVAGLRWTILRPGVVYGPGDRALRPLFRYAQMGIVPLVGNAAAAYTFIYIADAVRAIVAAVDRGNDGDVIFLGHEDAVDSRTLMQTIRVAAGSRAPIFSIPRAVVRIAAEAGEWAETLTGRPATINRRRFAELYSPGFVCRVDRMKERLGVVAEIGLREGLRIAAGWYLQT